MRALTAKFGTFKIGKFEKETGKSVMDLLDIGNFEVSKIATIIKLGNPSMKTDEEAYARLDEYLSADEEHSLISAFFDLIDELDKDLKIMKSCGIKVSEIKEQFKAEMVEKADMFNLKKEPVEIDITNREIENKPTEVVEV